MIELQPTQQSSRQTSKSLGKNYNLLDISGQWQKWTVQDLCPRRLAGPGFIEGS